MKKIRLSLAVVMLTVLMTTNVWASLEPEASEALSLPAIRIINDRNDVWSVKVWAYPGWATEWQAYSCQTLDYDVAWSRTIDPIKVKDGWIWPFTDHCGNYDNLTFWFRAWNRDTGEYRDYSTFGVPASWGAIWRWDGLYWTCSGCE